MKKIINEVIVVEGKHDSDTLHKYYEVDTIETNGTNLNKQTLNLIKKMNETRGVIIFTDPDVPGNKIRDRINKEIKEVKNAFIAKEVARTKKKVGIEHASFEDIENSLNNLVSYKEDYIVSISINELYDLNLIGNKCLRKAICDRLYIGACNNKTFIKRLNMLEINMDKLKSVIEELNEKTNCNYK